MLTHPIPHTYPILFQVQRTAFLGTGRQSFISSYYSVLMAKSCFIPLLKVAIMLRS